MALANTTAAVNATMRAVMWEGIAYNVAVRDVPKPTIINQTDAVVRISRAAICGSDLHIYRGTSLGPSATYGLGHEAVGYVEEVGLGVNRLQIGDPVIVPFDTAEGHLHTDLTAAIYGIYGGGYPHMGGMQAGDAVAVFGSGPVGLETIHAAFIHGASKVYAVDYVPERLPLAESLGAVPINFREADPVEQIRAYEPKGVARSIDAVGYEQVNRNLTVQSDVIIHNMLSVTALGGGLGTIGVYNGEGPDSPGAPRADTVRTEISLPMGRFFNSGFSWDTGVTSPNEVAPELVQLVASGKAHLGFIVSEEISIEDAPDAYRRFEKHETTKVVIKFD